MYLLINDKNIIIGTSAKPLSKDYCTEHNITLLRINKKEFNIKLLGSKLEKIPNDI